MGNANSVTIGIWADYRSIPFLDIECQPECRLSVHTEREAALPDADWLAARPPDIPMAPSDCTQREAFGATRRPTVALRRGRYRERMVKGYSTA